MKARSVISGVTAQVRSGSMRDVTGLDHHCHRRDPFLKDVRVWHMCSHPTFTPLPVWNL
jgi:hypothetical protein